MGPLFQPSQEGPRKPKGGPEAPHKCFHKGFHSILENRVGAGDLGSQVVRMGTPTQPKTKKGTARVALRGGCCPQPVGGHSPLPEKPGHVLGVRKKQTHSLSVHSNQYRSPCCAPRWRASSSQLRAFHRLSWPPFGISQLSYSWYGLISLLMGSRGTRKS